MRVHLLLAAIVTSLLVTGCARSEPPFTDNSQDTDLYVQSLRTMIERNCKEARSGDPSNPMAHLFMELGRDDRPVGAHKAVFLELRRVSREAVDLIRASNGQKPNITPQLDEMVKLAGQLPAKAGPPSRPPVE